MGNTKEKEHRALGELTASLGVDPPIFCGELMQHAAEGNPDAIYCKTKDELSLYLNKNVLPAGHVLVKGSRGMGLETIVDEIS